MTKGFLDFFFLQPSTLVLKPGQRPEFGTHIGQWGRKRVSIFLPPAPAGRSRHEGRQGKSLSAGWTAERALCLIPDGMMENRFLHPPLRRGESLFPGVQPAGENPSLLGALPWRTWRPWRFKIFLPLLLSVSEAHARGRDEFYRLHLELSQPHHHKASTSGDSPMDLSSSLISGT